MQRQTGSGTSTPQPNRARGEKLQSCTHGSVGDLVARRENVCDAGLEVDGVLLALDRPLDGLGEHRELRVLRNVVDVRVLLVDGVTLLLDFDSVLEDSQRVVEGALLLCRFSTSSSRMFTFVSIM